MNDEQLDWLARNMVGDVPEDAVRASRERDDELVFVTSYELPHGYSRPIEAIRKRQDELRNKPSWDDAPEGAKVLVQDSDGWWTWYRTDVDHDENEWSDDPEKWIDTETKGEVIGDWRDTKEFRPVVVEQPQLPPIGTRLVNQFGEVRTVIAHDGEIIVCRTEESPGYRGYTPGEQKTLKPEPSEEDKAVEEMAESLYQFELVGSTDVATCIAEYLIKEKGYRKQETGK